MTDMTVSDQVIPGVEASSSLPGVTGPEESELSLNLQRCPAGQVLRPPHKARRVSQLGSKASSPAERPGDSGPGQHPDCHPCIVIQNQTVKPLPHS